MSLLAQGLKLRDGFSESEAAPQEHSVYAKRIELITRITHAVIGTAPFTNFTAEIAELVRQAFGADACVIRMREDDDLILLGSAGIPHANLQMRIKIGWGISEKIMEERRPLFIADVRTDPATQPYLNNLPQSYRFTSYAGAPLLADDKVVGIVGIYTCERTEAITSTDLNHLQLVGNHIAVAILNENLYRELQFQRDLLYQAQKMESIGRLAGEIAHDFNNLLTAILGYNQLAQSELPSESPVMPYLVNVRSVSERAAALTRQLLVFARQQPLEPKTININDLVIELGGLLRRLLGADIELVTLTDPMLGNTFADPHKFEQVIINMAVNARDAMPNGGKLTLRTANATVMRPAALPSGEMPPGEYVLLSVSDTGTGMTEEVKQRIFEPYFTTKEVGKGTGIGLATCYGIIKQSDGHIVVDSTLGKGTTFAIYLPRTYETKTESTAAVIETPSVCGSETILLVEDEPSVREVMANALRNGGYTVREAAQGEEALRLISGKENEIDLLITDMVMPRMGGRELAERLAQTHPALRVLFVSGYTDAPPTSADTQFAVWGYLQKPFTPQSLRQNVREILKSPLPRVSEG